MNLMLAFITGLTTGGLSCLALQGGLLASSLAYQVEQDLQTQGNQKKNRSKFRARIAQPISLFLLAKLIAYTLLGVLLGALGSILQLSPMVSAMLMFAIGIFMIGNGLRMLKVHPIFRYFVLEPPSAITRYIRKKSKNGVSLFTPLFLGAMTILLPCGITQAMMATALGTGSPVQGAAIMFAFILGTIPVFFTIAYLTTRLGATLEKNFTRFVAVVLIVLGLVSINSGLNLSGSPVSFSKIFNRLTASSSPIPSQTGTSPANVLGDYAVDVRDNGYYPKVLHLEADKPVTLYWVTSNTRSCARSVVVPALDYQTVLPSNGQVAFDIPAQEKGTVINFSCSMGMYTGQLVFDLEQSSP